MIRKAAIGAATIVTVLSLGTGTAFAHQCYVASRSERGNAGAAHSQGWISFRSLATDFLGGELGLCQAGVNHVLSGLETEGFDVDVLIHSKVTLAWGMAEHSPNAEELLTDGKGVAYIDWEWIEATATPLIGAAFGICAAS